MHPNYRNNPMHVITTQRTSLSGKFNCNDFNDNILYRHYAKLSEC